MIGTGELRLRDAGNAGILREVMAAAARLREQRPLIHCITSPIAINDCANVLLAVGARPIMAEHPDEVAEITGMSEALAVSLANITDARMESMMRAGGSARTLGRPVVLDAVGVTCSSLRLTLARRFMELCRPAVVKGNSSEIRALSGARFGNCGVDTAESDRLLPDQPERIWEMGEIVRTLARRSGAAVLVTGEVDLLGDGEQFFAIENGVPELGLVTGTGCILNCLTAAYLAVAEPLTAALTATLLMGIAGEHADSSHGLGSYHVGLIDALSRMKLEELLREARLRRM